MCKAMSMWHTHGLVYAAQNAELCLTQPSGCSDMCNAVCDVAQENIAMSV